VIDRLKGQTLRQLIDERLRVQEAQRRKIIIGDSQIAEAIREIEARNNMQPGALRQKLRGDGISSHTLIDQIRAQLAWSQILHETAAEKLVITDAEVAEQQKLMEARTGQPEYRLGEIFIAIDDPANTADAQRFAETVINELRAGAMFGIVAAQFSQNESALDGGALGWVQPDRLDPEVARVVTQMPIGAVSNPIRVPGGISIVTLLAKREIGRDMATIASVRQAFFAFSQPLTDPADPTEQQRQMLEKAKGVSMSVKSCAEMDQYAKTNNPAGHAADPGEIRIENVNPPAFRDLLSSIPLGKPTEPLVSRDGIAVMVVCSRDLRNMAETTPQDIQRRLANERVEMMSRQMMRALHRQSDIDIRKDGA
jgi:peptidyl-prolyl cis-trans isomerase SurA